MISTYAFDLWFTLMISTYDFDLWFEIVPLWFQIVTSNLLFIQTIPHRRLWCINDYMLHVSEMYFPHWSLSCKTCKKCIQALSCKTDHILHVLLTARSYQGKCILPFRGRNFLSTHRFMQLYYHLQTFPTLSCRNGYM